jgi:hypothetical protein
LSWSLSESDILAAVAAGHSYFTYGPTDLMLDLDVEGQTFGCICPLHKDLKVNLSAKGLETGDQIKLIDQDGERLLFTSPAKGEWRYEFLKETAGYIRLEVWRTFFPGIPMLPALVSNPIWFCD